MGSVIVRTQRAVVVVRRPAIVVRPNPVIVVTQRPAQPVIRTVPSIPPKVVVRGKGLRGEAGPQNLFVQPAPAPVFELPGVWVETGLGPLGEDLTLWVEDGT